MDAGWQRKAHGAAKRNEDLQRKPVLKPNNASLPTAPKNQTGKFSPSSLANHIHTLSLTQAHLARRQRISPVLLRAAGHKRDWCWLAADW